MTDRQVGNAKDMLQFIGDIIEGRMLGALYYFFWLNVRLALLIGFLLVVTHFIIKNYKFTDQFVDHFFICLVFKLALSQRASKS